jgi:sugar diacid utilization regulator
MQGHLPDAFASAVVEDVGVILLAHPGPAARDDVAALVAGVLDELDPADGAGDQGVVAGVGSPVHALVQVATSYRQARVATDVARQRRRRVCRWDDFPLDAMLATMLPSARDDAMIPEPIRSLPRTQHATTLDLLELYLDRGCNVVDTASELHLHRATVYQRLARFEQNTGLDLNDGQDRLMLHLWLKTRRYGRASGDT